MSVDIATLGLEVRSDGVVVASDRLNKLTQEGGKAEAATSKLSSTFDKLGYSTQSLIKYIEAAAGALALMKLAEVAKDAALLAARYDTLGVVMAVTGKNATYTSMQMDEFQKSLQKTGISAVESRNGLIRMGQAQIDMANSSKLARIAQDAAVVGNINSSEAFERMMTGLATGQSIILHHLGLMTNFEQAYINSAHAMGKVTSDLTETEKAQIRVNEVVRAGVGIQGAYEAAMGTVGKQLTSLPRYIQDLMVKIGEVGQGPLFAMVSGLTDSLKYITKNFEDIASAASALGTGGAIVAFGILSTKAVDYANALAVASQHSAALRMNTLYDAEADVKRTASLAAVSAEELRRAEVLQVGIAQERESAVAKLQSVSANDALISSELSVAETEAAQANARTTRITTFLAQIAAESEALKAKSTLTKSDMAFENELRNQEFANRSKLITAMSEQSAAEVRLAAIQDSAIKSAQARTIALTELAAISKEASVAETQLAAATESAATSASSATVAETSLAASMGTASLSGRVLTGVMGGLNTVLALVGGPIGAIAIAIAGITYEVIKFLEKAEAAQNRLMQLQNQGDFAQTLAKLKEIEDLNRKLEQEKKSPAEVAKANTAQMQEKINKAVKENVDLERQRQALIAAGDNKTAADTWTGKITEWDKVNTKIKDNNNLIQYGMQVNKEMNDALAKQAELRKSLHPDTKPPSTIDPEAQARYDKQLLDAEAALKQQYADNSRHREESALKDRLAQLQYEKDMGLKTTQEYLESKYSAEIEAQKKELKLAEDTAHDRFLNYAKVSADPAADRLMQAKAEDDWAKSVGKASEAQAKLNATIAQQPRDNDRHTRDMQHYADEMNIQHLQIEGNTIAANAAANELKYSDMRNKGYTDAEINLQRVNDTLKIANDLYARQVAVRNELAALDSANGAKAAEMVGIDPKTGTINTIADQTAHALAIQQSAHGKRMEMIEQERQAALDAYRLSSRSAEDYAKVIGIVGAKERERALAEQDNANKTAEIHTKATSGQLAEVGNYTSLAGQLFGGLADMQDQSSRRGFETAKAMNLAAAVMSTATAIIAQLSGPDAWTPIAWARSAAAAALGAMQIAKIESTSFGGGASAPSASAGSFGGGSAGAASGIGSSIGQQVHSAQETQTEASLRKLAESSNNASLAIGKVADGLTKVSELFDTDYSQNLMKGLQTDGPKYQPGVIGQTVNDVKSGSALALYTGALSSLVSHAFGIGNSWNYAGAGFGLAMNNGEVGGQNYTVDKKDGGWFTDSKYRANFSPLDAGMSGAMGDYMEQIKGAIVRAAVSLGTGSDFSKASVAPAVIQTSGRTAADIQKDVDKFFTDAANSLAKTTTGLKEFTFYGEDAFTALMRLSTSLQGVNAIFELTGHTLIQSTLGGADAAYRLADAFGGLDNMTKAVKTYYEGMYSDTERAAMEAAQAAREVSVAFSEMGMAAPSTREQFRNLVNSLDVTTASGADLYKSLMDISPAFITMTDAVDKANKALRDSALAAAQSAASALVDIMGGNLSTGSIESIYRQKQQAFDDALAAGRTTEIPELGKALLEASRQYNASGAGYTADYDKVIKALADVAGMQGSPTLTAAEKQVQLLTDIKNAIETGTMTNLAGFAGQLASGSAVSNALGSETDSAMQQKALLASQAAMQMAIGRARPDLQYDIAPIGHPDGVVDGGDALVWQELSTGALKWADIGLPAFASGGITSGPSIAGEGYYREAIIPLPDGRSVPVSFTGAADNYQSNAELIAEIRALRQEVSELKGHAAANVRVSQAGFSELIDQGDQSNRTNSQIAQKIRLGAAGPQ